MSTEHALPSTDLDLPVSFRRLAWSNLAAQSAEQIALACASLVAVVTLGAGAAEVGFLQTVLTLPFVLVAIPAGLLADRIRRGRLMAGAEWMRVVALSAIVAALVSGTLTLPWLAAAGFVAVCGTVVFSVAAPALVPSLVSERVLPLANARIELARTAAFAAGPALGGALVGLIGASVAFGTAVALSCLAALLLGRIEEAPRPLLAARQPLRDVWEGLSFVARQPLLAAIFVTQAFFNTAFFVVFAVLVPHAVHGLGLAEAQVGLLLGTYGAGMLAGALLAPKIMARLRFGTVVATGPICGFAASVLMALTSVWPSPILAAASLLLFGVGPILWVISTTTLRQDVTPAALLGRVSAVNILTYGARPLGSALAAFVAAERDVASCLWLAVALFAVQAGIVLISALSRLEKRPAMA